MKSITRKIISMALVLMLVLSLVPASVFAAANTDVAVKSANIATKANNANVQNAVTLHCWNWSYANIEANLDKIAAAGFTAVQTSPIQPIKEATNASWSTVQGQWWVYYQPTEFKINTATNNALGTKAQFQSMCAAAEKKGIKVIVDVVANHLADNGANTKSSAIPSYLRDNSAYWHDISKNTNDYNNRYEVTQFCMAGLPDLNTGNKDIQNYVLSFLKECVDAGADGFRFDAAKHIEVPEDSYCGSDFWPTVINGIKSYKSDVYIYGEILDGTGGTDIGNYTEYMSVTDNNWSDKVRENVINSGNAGNFYYSYDKGVSADKVVLWAESHDTYANDNGASYGDSTQNINKTWAIVAARAGAMGLYFARPSDFNQKLGVASTNTGWNWAEVVAVNKFHNDFLGEGEYTSNSNGYAMVERGNSGAVIVNVGSNGDVNIPVYKMANGTYTDQISGNTFTVSNGRITGKITHQCGYAVIYNSCSHTWTVTGTTSASCTTDAATNYKCSKCGQTKSEVTASATGHSFSGGKCTVCGAAEPDDLVVYFKNVDGWSTVNVYYWSDADEEMVTWPGKAMKLVKDDIYSYTIPEGAQYVIFNDGNNQTDDLTLPTDGRNYYNNGSWLTYTTCSHPSHNTSGICTSCGVATAHKYVNGTCSICGVAKPSDKTIYFDNSNKWPTVYIYFWNDGDITYTEWPGEVMTKVDGTIYSYTVPGDTTKVIFHNNNGDYEPSANKTADLTIEGNLYTMSTGKWSNYNVCEHTYTSKVTTAATCTSAGVKTFTCSKCADSYTESIAALGHTYVNGACSTCGAKETCTSHSWNSGSVTTAATCTAAGVKTYTCSKCGETKTESVSALGHNYVNGTCSRCGDKETKDTITIYFQNNWMWSEICVHYWGSANYADTTWPGKAMTFFEKDTNYDIYAVEIPSDVTGIVINGIKDDGSGNRDQSPDITSGISDGVCFYMKWDNGNQVGAEDITVMLPDLVCDHAWTAATCTTAKTCSKCGETEGAALGHKMSAATCTAPKTCSVCGATEGAALSHSYTSKVTAPTCTAAGYTTYTCSKCSHSYTGNTVAATGHSYTSKVTAPTCGADGYTTYTCSACGDSYTANTVPATGEHSAVYTYNDGTHTVICNLCGKTVTLSGTDEFKINSAYLTLASDVSVIFRATIPAGFENAYMVFNVNGVEYTAYSMGQDAQGRDLFSYPGINPQMMGDNINAVLYATVDGMEVTPAKTVNYSVLTYCNKQLPTAGKNFKTLISDLLTYGAASQIKLGYKTDALVTDLATTALTPSTFPGASAITNQQAAIGDKNSVADVTGVGLNLSNQVVCKFGFTITDTDLSKYTIKIVIGSKETLINASECYSENGKYWINYCDYSASQFDETITVTLWDGSTQMGRTFTYSVNSYFAKNANSSDAGLAGLVQAVYNYGASAAAYVANPNG